MRHRGQIRNNSTEDSGHDSFLDIVANLVGILVILIMVIGVRARHAWQCSAVTPLLSSATATSVERPEPLDKVQQQVGQKAEEVIKLERDTHQLDAKSQQAAELAAEKREQRDQLQLLVSAAEADIAERERLLEEIDRQEFQVAQQIADTESELKHIQQAVHAVEAAITSQQQKHLLHYPTPLAKMVFGHEEHFRLMGNRLVFVPMTEITDQVRADAKSKLWKLENANEVIETIGPVGGFRARYTMVVREKKVTTEMGVLVRRLPELAHMTLIPVAEPMGELAEKTLNNNSELAQFIRSHDPTETTITIWTYPDSYPAHRRLKEMLHGMGFQCASIPLSEGQPIGASSNGFRSAAE